MILTIALVAFGAMTLLVIAAAVASAFGAGRHSSLAEDTLSEEAWVRRELAREGLDSRTAVEPAARAQDAKDDKFAA